MECEVPRRPHTVGALPKVWTQSPLIMNLLEEIEKEAKGPVSRPKSPQKNYMKENLKRLKEIQVQAKRKLAEKQPLKPLRVPNHYHDVQSKILINPSHSNEKRAEGNIYNNPPKTAGPGNMYNNPPKTAGPHRSQPPLSPCVRPKSERLTVPQQYRSLPDLNQVEDNNQNFEITNKDMKTPRSDIISGKNSHSLNGSKRKPEVPHRLGQIPNYLTERKKQWELERERQLKLSEEASIPKGYTLLPDEERIETLELLKKNQEEILQSLAVLPVRNDTIRLRSYKEELEHQLAKVEEGIKIFSRPKVLIKNDT